MKQKTVLIFVLSVNDSVYAPMMRNSMETWDAEGLPGTETVYYHGMPQVPESLRVVSFPVLEDYATISAKNLMAFAWALQKPWDYMARVNASCYVKKDRLLAHCQSLPETGLIQGVIADPTEQCGVRRPWTWGGGQFILSRDVVEAIVAHPEKINHRVMEDVAMSEIALDLGFELNGAGKVCSLNKNGDGWLVMGYGGPSMDMKEWGDIPDHYFFRVKNDADRTVDGEVMRLLKEHLK